MQILTLSAIAALLTVAAQAQSIAVVHSTGDRVALHDVTNGAERETTFLDLDAITGDLARTPYAIVSVDGELWVTDTISDTIFRISSDGGAYLGKVAGPLDRVRGITPAPNGGAWVANAGGNNGAPKDSVVRIASDGTTVQVIGVPSPADVIQYTFQGIAGLLVSDDFNNAIWFIDPQTGTTQPFHTSDGVTGVDEPRQLHVTANGSVLLAGWGNRPGIYVYDQTGMQTSYVDTMALAGLSGIQGISELATGDWLFTNGLGVHVFDRSEGTIQTVSSGSCRFMSSLPEPQCECSSFCTATPNSSGAPGRLRAVGSSRILDSELSLVATSVPPNTTVLFLASTTQDFIQNPGGHTGNLCLGGAIGRFARAGELRQADSLGVAVFSPDATTFPTPTGPTAVAAGEAWSFQAWFRDSMGGAPTSNFTDGAIATFL